MFEALSKDAFLGGQLHVWQPKVGYRAGIDPVLLAASIEAKPGQTVLEIGCGVGTAALCLNARVTGLRLTGVELQEAYASLAQKNQQENQAQFEIVCADLRNLPSELRQKQFHHVMMNPPYFDRAAGNRSIDQGKDIAFAGETALKDWLDVGIRRLAPRGYLTIIQKIDRLADVLTVVDKKLGSIIIKPIAPRNGKPANVFILRARQDGKTPLQMSAPLVLHDGIAHESDKESYTAEVKSILRDGFPLSLGD